MIEVRDLRKSFGQQPILDGVSFQIEEGESLVIIGRSGSGKSVLLKHIIGLLQPDSGQVLIDGEDITHMKERELIRVRRQFGMVFQGAALFDSMTVSEHVGFALRRQPGIERKKPSELSGGMRKRVGLARAIVYQPSILLYDEPTTGLDPIVSDSIDQLIMRVTECLKVTTIVVTHDMRTARRVGHRMVMLHNKKIYATGTPEDIFASTDPVVQQFINGVADP
jgi:phospholipid/cholesterol/gamma-HCH transport system ATP-binding protein